MRPFDHHPCVQCGLDLPPKSLGNRCPRCLLRLALTPPPEELVGELPVLNPGAPAEERRFFGAFELLGEISRGGMGVVYRARQFNPEREVALKMILPAGRTTPAARLRFAVEIAAVARLHHPWIVSLYESGEAEGVCYFSMRLVRGAGLDQRLAEGYLTGDLAARIDLLIEVTQAVHYAHQHGILHRDLKPSNILIDDAGEPCITDFGLAKIQESDAGLTQDHSVLGSPSYMAPEQAAGKGGEVTTAVDIYSLGAILYELLTGRPPFLGSSPLEILRQVLEQPPIPPRQRLPRLSRDLESICLQALEKQPARRYASALALAEDLERWRRGQPVRARPVRPWVHAWRWCLRKPAWAALLGVSVVSLVALAGGSALVARRLQIASDAAGELVRRLQHEKAERYLANHETPKGLALLAHLLRERPDDVVVGTRLLSALRQRPLAVPLVRPWISGHEVLAVGFTRDGHFSSAIARQGRFRRIEMSTGRSWDATLAAPGESLLLAALHPDGSRVATAHVDGSLRLWQTSEPAMPEATLAHDTPVKQVAFGPDSTVIATLDQQGVLRWWRPDADQPPLSLGARREWTSTLPSLPPGERVNTMTYSSDGRWFAVGTESGRAYVLATATGDLQPEIRQVPGSVQVLAFDAQSRRLAVASSAAAVTYWPLNSPSDAMISMSMEATPIQLEFSPDGRFLAAAGWSRENQAFVWDTTTGRRIDAQLLHHLNVSALRFSPDGRQLITLGHDNSARRWDTRTWKPLGEPLVHLTTPRCIAFSSDRLHLMTGTYSGVVWWDLSPPPSEPERLHEVPRVTRAAFSPDGARLALGSQDGRIHFWSMPGKSNGPSFQAQPDAVLFLSYNHSGSHLITFGIDGVARLWDGRSGDATGPPLTHPSSIYSAAFSPDDRRVLTAGLDGSGRIWDLHTGTQAMPPLVHGAPVHGARYDPLGKRIVTFSGESTARLWNAQTGAAVGEPLQHDGGVLYAEFSPDGHWLVTAGLDAKIRLWQAATGERAHLSVEHQNTPVKATFSPDGQWLASASVDTTVQVLRLGAHPPPPALISHAAALVSVQFSPDSRWLLTLSADGVARIWDPATGLPLSEPLSLSNRATQAFFSPDGAAVLLLGGDSAPALWWFPPYEASAGGVLSTVAELVGRMTMIGNNRFELSQVSAWDVVPTPIDLRLLTGGTSPWRPSPPSP